ncbi:MAG: hypothetical protein QM695_06935 [Micropruina sp.]
MWVATAGDPGWLTLGALAGGAGAALAWRKRSWALAAVALVLLGCMLTGAARWWSRGHDPLTRLAQEQAVGVAEVTVVGTPRQANDRASGRRGGPAARGWRSSMRAEIGCAAARRFG